MMRRALTRVGLAAAMAATSWCTIAKAQETEGKPAKGAEHKVLEQYVGTWQVTGTVYPDGPESKPVKLAGTDETKFLADSSWLVTRQRITLDDKQQAEGVEIFCYDAKRAKYTGTGAHSAFPPPLSIYEGTYDEASRTLTWAGEEAEAEGGGKLLWKVTNQFRGDDSFKVISHVKKSGSKDFVKSYELDYKRVKKSG